MVKFGSHLIWNAPGLVPLSQTSTTVILKNQTTLTSLSCLRNRARIRWAKSGWDYGLRKRVTIPWPPLTKKAATMLLQPSSWWAAHPNSTHHYCRQQSHNLECTVDLNPNWSRRHVGDRHALAYLSNCSQLYCWLSYMPFLTRHIAWQHQNVQDEKPVTCQVWQFSWGERESTYKTYYKSEWLSGSLLRWILGHCDCISLKVWTFEMIDC